MNYSYRNILQALKFAIFPRNSGNNQRGSNNNNIQITELEAFPEMDIGAPSPSIVTTEREVILVYYCSVALEPDTDVSLRAVNPSKTVGPLAMVKFESCYTHKFGPPNDEALNSHPLFRFGLQPYCVQEVSNSPWISELCKMNSGHLQHNSELFSDYRHFIFTFKDNTFECIARDYEIKQTQGSIVAGLSDSLTELLESVRSG